MVTGTTPTSDADLTTWHAAPVTTVVERLATMLDTGIDQAEATRRLTSYGPNR